MELVADKNGRVLKVRLIGELDHHSAKYTRDSLDNMLKDQGIVELQLDLLGLGFMDSSGIGVLLGRYKQLSKRGGKVLILNPNNHVDKILRLSGVYTVIERGIRR